jgi:hypothetical protein
MAEEEKMNSRPETRKKTRKRQSLRNQYFPLSKQLHDGDKISQKADDGRRADKQECAVEE